MFVYPGFEGLKIISAGKGGGWERVPVLWSHRDKRINEWYDWKWFFFTFENIFIHNKTWMKKKKNWVNSILIGLAEWNNYLSYLWLDNYLILKMLILSFIFVVYNCDWRRLETMIQETSANIPVRTHESFLLLEWNQCVG